MSTRPHVFLATPCFGGLLTTGYMQSVLGLMAVAGQEGFDLSQALLGHDALITRCRNTLVAAFLRSGASHLLFVDSDIAFGAADVIRLLRAGKDVAGGFYPLKALNWERAALNRQRYGEADEAACLMYVGKPCEPAEAEDGLIAAEYAGTGFLMIRRGVLERMIAAYPALRYRTVDAWPLREGPETDQYALFDTMIEPATARYLSEDYAFCRRWRAIGGRIWLDPESRLEHMGTHEYQGTPSRRYGAATVLAQAS